MKNKYNFYMIKRAKWEFHGQPILLTILPIMGHKVGKVYFLYERTHKKKKKKG